MQPGKMIVVGFFLVLIGAVLPFLMMIRTVDSTFFLNAVAFMASVIGMFLGVIGAAQYVGNAKQEHDRHDRSDR